MAMATFGYLVYSLLTVQSLTPGILKFKHLLDSINLIDEWKILMYDNYEVGMVSSTRGL